VQEINENFHMTALFGLADFESSKYLSAADRPSFPGRPF
jgi:hypothetical protein